jgi:ribose/xylose/arabinose/galactoside ABC-type transport system permease subunit
MTSASAIFNKAWRSLGPFLGLLAVVVLFAYAVGDFGRLSRGEPLKFLSEGNIRNILNQSAIIGVVSIGMTLVIVGGGIDLSVGSIVALAAVTVALVVDGKFPSTLSTKFVPFGLPVWSVALGVFVLFLFLQYRATRRFSWARAALWMIPWAVGCVALAENGAWPAVVGAAFIGLVFGHLNGLVISMTGVAPFIVTLGAMVALRGVTERLSGETKINVDDIGKLMNDSPWLINLMHASDDTAWLGIVTPGVWVLCGVALVAGLLLNRTRLGRWILAVGSNEEAARLSGVPTAAVKLWMYSLAGFLTGVAGVLQFARLSSGDPAAGTGYELDAVAAVVIGGGSLRGGEGSVLGAVLGTLLMGVLRNGCQLLNYPTSLQSIIIGCIIVAAVTFDEMRHRNRRQ